LYLQGLCSPGESFADTVLEPIRFGSFNYWIKTEIALAETIDIYMWNMEKG